MARKSPDSTAPDRVRPRGDRAALTSLSRPGVRSASATSARSWGMRRWRSLYAERDLAEVAHLGEDDARHQRACHRLSSARNQHEIIREVAKRSRGRRRDLFGPPRPGDPPGPLGPGRQRCRAVVAGLVLRPGVDAALPRRDDDPGGADEHRGTGSADRELQGPGAAGRASPGRSSAGGCDDDPPFWPCTCWLKGCWLAVPARTLSSSSSLLHGNVRPKGDSAFFGGTGGGPPRCMRGPKTADRAGTRSATRSPRMGGARTRHLAAGGTSRRPARRRLPGATWRVSPGACDPMVLRSGRDGAVGACAADRSGAEPGSSATQRGGRPKDP